MDALNFEYPDYEKLDKGAEEVKRKRIVSILSRQAAIMVKEDEKALKKTKIAPEPKVAVSKKRKPEVSDPKVTEATEETPTPSATDIAEILKIITQSLPIQLLSPLRSELTQLLQKKDKPSATKAKAEGQKKPRIVNVVQAVERTPPLASVSRIAHVASVEATAEAETSVEAAAAAEAANLESTMLGIDKLLSDMAAEEIAAAAEKVMVAVPDKGKRLLILLQKKKILTFET
jgi:hypothetical protein